MSTKIEREVKLRFDSAEAARAAIEATGATRLAPRRLQDDGLLDTADGQLQQRGCLLRLRVESGEGRLTFKGPGLSSRMKVREEHETTVGDAKIALRLFEELGYVLWFRYQKYREEFARHDVVIALDETPMGTFVELEGTEEAIDDTATALGRTPVDYVLESYRGLFLGYCEAHGLSPTHMVFE